MVNLVVDNILLDKPYRLFGSVKGIKEQFQTEWSDFLFENWFKRGVILNNAPNRIGKTITTLKFFHDENEIDEEEIWTESGSTRTLYLADRHQQITEVKKTLENLNMEYFRQWYGIKHLCPRNDPTHNFLIDNHATSGIICQYCELKDNCGYWQQFKYTRGYVIGAPKEFLPTKYIQKKKWDNIVVDEVIDKARKIYPTCPEITEEIFEAYGVPEDHYYLIYETVKDFKDNILKYKKLDDDIRKSIKPGIGPNYDLVLYQDGKRAQFKYLKEECGTNQYLVLSKLTNAIQREPELMYDPGMRDLFSFYNNLSTTVEWLEYGFRFGFRTHYYKPYLQDVLDLKGKYRSYVVILNTSLDRPIFDCLSDKKIPLWEIKEFSFSITNKNSILYHYNLLYRSCPKGALFELNKQGRILKDHGIPIVKKGYGKEVIQTATEILDFCRDKDLRTGLITFKGAEELFKPHVDVVGHFGGHQGSNAFDDVDFLVVLGTYHLNPTALYQKHYIIHNEFLGDKPANWNTPSFINGVRINLSDNEKLNQVKLYKLNEEHQQAIFRSGANVYPEKIVVVFGYVPPGVEEVLDYRPFNSKRGLKISISKWLKKIKSLNNSQTKQNNN